MNSAPNRSLVFSEVQHFTQWWLWLIVWSAVALVVGIFIWQILLGHPVGNNPAPDGVLWLIALLVGAGMPLLFRWMNLATDVYADRIVIRFVPMWRRTVLLSEITNCTPRDYHPILEYGGWGIRYGIGRGMCYTISGNRGVRIELVNGKKLLVSSQRAEELAAAINGRRLSAA